MSIFAVVCLKQAIGISVLGANSVVLGNSKLVHPV